MLRLYNTLSRRLEVFRPANEDVVTVFTCGPSVYQRSHVGNFRTFLFEDIVVRYLEYLGYRVVRGMNYTDVEDKAIKEAEHEGRELKAVTEQNILQFIREMKLLSIKLPDHLPRASEHVKEAVEIISELLARKQAYWHSGNVYFSSLSYPGFGKLYGLDLSRWPKKTKRFHRDTYPGVQWNLGDFVLWHGCKGSDGVCWDTAIGSGRPSWNIQDPAMISSLFHETLSIYCGGIDNLYRHHDYTLAVLESIRPYPMASFWLHGEHLLVNGQKMSKSKGNILYTDDLKRRGYSMSEIRFFLVYGHYRERLSCSEPVMEAAVERLRALKERVLSIRRRARSSVAVPDGQGSKIIDTFERRMNNDLDVRGALDGIADLVIRKRPEMLTEAEAADIIVALMKVDAVLQVIF